MNAAYTHGPTLSDGVEASTVDRLSHYLASAVPGASVGPPSYPDFGEWPGVMRTISVHGTNIADVVTWRTDVGLVTDVLTYAPGRETCHVVTDESDDTALLDDLAWAAEFVEY
jgi:hypothetical protein